MKSILISILFLFVPKLTISQTKENIKKDGIVYIDSLGAVATKDNYKFVRIIKEYKIDKKEPYQVREYYKSGKIALIGSITSNLDYIRTGTFLGFYENGSRKFIENYIDNKLFGSYFEFYDNGDKKLEAENIEDDKNYNSQEKIKQFWDRNGVQKVVNGNGFYEFKDDKESEKGELKDGLKDGIWEGSQGKFSYKENYVNGKLISGISVDEFLKLYSYNNLLLMAFPKKGMRDFLNFIVENIRVPEGVTGGKVVVAFQTDENGVIVDPKTITELDYGVSKEVIRVVKLYGNWIPGEKRGRKVRCYFNLPINIQSTN